MTTRGAGNARGELGTPSWLDAGKVWPAGCPTETPRASIDKDGLAKLVAKRVITFIVQGLLILLWFYVFNSMREYAISYTGGDTRFSTFAAIVVAVPIAEIFCILGQALVPPPPSSSLPIHGSSASMPCNTADDSEVVPTEEVDTVFLYLEKGLASGYTAPPTADTMTRAAMEAAKDVAAVEAALDMAAPRIKSCVVQALLILLWVYFVDLMRRYIATQGVGVLLFTMLPLLILAAGVTAFLCLLMEWRRGQFILNEIVTKWSIAGSRLGS